MLTLQQSLQEIESYPLPVVCRVSDYPLNALIEPHTHGKHQLVYAIQGVMVVHTEAGVWVVPPTRAIWMPAGMQHWIRCIGTVLMRSLFVAPEAAAGLPQRCEAVGISPLLRELIRAAAEIELPYVPKSRDGRLMRLLLDELRVLPALPLHLPQPADPRLQHICTQIQRAPEEVATLVDWAQQLGVDVKTIQRLFARDTGMTFGQWRQQARLLNALERLAQGERVLDVALALGYDSPSAFAAMFKRQFGQTPSQFFS
ncbi:MAG TPA: helix-turn-helix transcriptional regulator [Rhodocyclaceae bacterium]|nr:helix-turn-helix transcriptional regulator [Rhodocyclaceae bacterium]